MAVRRHGGPMMVVVTVMAVALHLLKPYVKTPRRVNVLLAAGRGEAENGAVRTRRKLAVSAIAVLSACLAAPAQNRVRDPYRGSKTSAAAPSPEARIDINHAAVDELLKVPGMTRSWAGRIVRFRPYRTKQDLIDRGVLNSDVYDRIKDYVIAHRDKQ